ncbi:hypothetical protein ACFLVI_00530 [Chloroflexota bacterium]
MGKVFSLPVAITSILVLAFGGMAVIEFSNVGAIIIWVICLAWFGGLIWYLRQHIDIQVTTCELDGYYLTVIGWVKARHKYGVCDLQLCLGNTHHKVYRDHQSKYPPEVESYFKEFHVWYALPQHLLTRDSQNSPCLKDDATIRVLFVGSEWTSDKIKMPLKDGQKLKMKKVK